MLAPLPLNFRCLPVPSPCLLPSPRSFPDLPYDEEADIKAYADYAKKLLPFVTDTIE